MKIVVLGLSLTSSWGNGHATTYRGLIKALCARGHEVLFLERDVPWYAPHRDMVSPPFGQTELYPSVDALQRRHREAVARADAVIVGSYVPDGAVVTDWVLRTARGVTAFYDIDTPITLAGLANDAAPYLRRAQVPHFDVYLSFTGGPTLTRLEQTFGARRARPLYCSVDPELHRPDAAIPLRYALGYLGTYSEDRQPLLEELLCAPAERSAHERFVVAGALYPESVRFPQNVEHREHVPPHEHGAFYRAQRFTLNLTRAQMRRAGYSPSVRLFEAAACGTPIISDTWPGLETFLEPDKELLVARDRSDVLRYLEEYSEADAAALGERARRRILRGHTATVRAKELESYLTEAMSEAPSRATWEKTNDEQTEQRGAM